LTKDVIAIVKVEEEALIDAIPLAEIKSVMEMNAVEQNGEGSDPNTSIKSQNNSFKGPKRGMAALSLLCSKRYCTDPNI
jgi:hypothetical protein